LTDRRTHPFQGGIPYPWDRPEAKALHEALSQAVREPGRIDMMARAAAPAVPALNLGWSPGRLWQQALEDICLGDRLLVLCENLAAEQGLVAVARAARVVLDARPAVERRLGVDERLVVDRETFGTHLAELSLDGAMVKVLLVRGQPRTGKTWSRHLFERAARDRGADVVYLRGLIVPTVRDVVQKLFEVLDAPDNIPPSDTTDAAWFRLVCYRLPAVAARRRRPLWIAMDDLGLGPDGVTPLIDSDIRAFFDQLALTLEDPSTNRWIRLLLIHYPDVDVPTRWSEDVWKEDRTRPEDVTAEHVAEVLREWREDHGLTLLDDQITARARAVIDRADAPLPPHDARARQPRLRRIHDEVRAELASLAGGGG